MARKKKFADIPSQFNAGTQKTHKFRNSIDESRLPRSAYILRRRRIEMELSQQDVANLAGFEQMHYQRYEYGVYDIAKASMRIGLTICDVLEINPFFLIFGHNRRW